MKQINSKGIGRDFFADVYAVVQLVPAGRVTTYGAIARYLGAGRSARMVGYALNSSFSQPGEIPAHRVVNRNGKLSGKHHFPPERPMEELLRAEGVAVENEQVRDFERLFWDPAQELSLD